jgi:N utilization substance protein A
MSALVGGTSTPLDSIKEELGDSIFDKLTAGGVTTIEAIADMTPEELEQIEGIGPKSIEKIAEAVNNYFSRLEGTATTVAAEESEATGLGEDSAGQSGDNAGLDTAPAAEAESVNELDETGQGFEADVVDGVENAPDADEAEVHTHGEEGRDDKE